MTIDIFINHFDNDHAILFSLFVCANVYRPTKCIRADKINNHHTVYNKNDILRLRNEDAMYATGPAIIKLIMMIDIRSICGDSIFLTRGR